MLYVQEELYVREELDEAQEAELVDDYVELEPRSA